MIVGIVPTGVGLVPVNNQWRKADDVAAGRDQYVNAYTPPRDPANFIAFVVRRSCAFVGDNSAQATDINMFSSSTGSASWTARHPWVRHVVRMAGRCEERPFQEAPLALRFRGLHAPCPRHLPISEGRPIKRTRSRSAASHDVRAARVGRLAARVPVDSLPN